VLKIQAKVGDEIVVMIQQPDGTQYQISQSAYLNPNGATTVGPNGGAVTSTDGTITLAIPKGAITGSADITLTAKPESAITIPRTGVMDPSNAPWGATVEINAQGNFTLNQEVHLEAPAPSTIANGTPVAWMKQGSETVGGQAESFWQVVTSGRVDAGRFKTNSPPFDGIFFGIGISDFMVFTPTFLRIVLGTVTQPPDATQTQPQPVPGVLCIIGDNILDIANTVAARTNAQGLYATFDFSVVAPNAASVVAIDTKNNRRGGAVAAPQTSMNPLYQQGLQGFANTLRGDILLPAATTGGGGTPPAVTLTAVQPGIPTAQDSLVQFRTVPVGASIAIQATIDRPIVPPTGGVTGQVFVGGALNQTLSWVADQSQKVWSANFTANAEGSYSVVVKASTNLGDPTAATQVSFAFIALVNPNSRPPLPGPPFVLDMTPID